ncbi:FtsK/SpoIIIE domain-containing protein, partial [Saccharopolyspora sp. NPDC047091]|uniref:FtsK/SpoIIIE domain-containing protein n=1 Tax=Saccharopolyspora sp. NPDC047091 TaxID=3155924 RepID=UPI0033D6B0F8
MATKDTNRTPARAAASWAVHHPRTTLSTPAAGALVLLAGLQLCGWIIGIGVLVGVTWRLLDQPTFDAFAWRFARAWYVRWWSYQRKWDRIATRCGLALQDPFDGTRHLPRIRRVRSTLCWDSLELRLPEGQELSDIADASERLRSAYRVDRVAVREITPGRVSLDFQRREPFHTMPVPAAAMPRTAAEVDLRCVPVGRDEFGKPWTLSLLDSHLAYAGATGAGKSSVPWNVFRSIAPLIADGSVRLHVIDPKGIEMTAAREIYTSYAVTDEENVALVQALRKSMMDRKKDLQDQGIRKVVISPNNPLDLLYCDEFAAPFAYAPRKLQDQFEEALGLVLTQGRAFGTFCFGGLQEPTKDKLPVRDLFPRRLAMRLPTPGYVDA